MIASCVAAFFIGAATEGICTLWVASVARRQALRSGFLSSVWAMSLLMGLSEALPGRWPAIFWVLGYGWGSYAVVRMTKGMP